MNCADIRELAPLWHAGELQTAQWKAFDAHLAECAVCAGELGDQRRLDGFLRDFLAADPAGMSAAAQRLEQRVLRQIARERFLRRLVPVVAVAAAVVAAAFLLTMHRGTPVNPVIFADATRDHTVEVLQASPRRWKTAPAELAELETSQGISDVDIQALQATGYRLERAKICRLAGVRYIHLVYGKAGREFSVYLKVRGSQALEKTASMAGSLRLSAFAQGRVEAVIVSDAPEADCERFTRAAEGAL